MDNHKPYIRVTSGMRGYFPVLLVWDEEMKFYEPYLTGSTCKTYDEAVSAAEEWAEAEELEYRP